MLLVLPETSAVRSASYLTPQSYEYYPSHVYYSNHGAPRFAAPSCPSQLDFLRQPSVQEFEEREYRRALEVIANHRHRQAEKEALIRRQRLAEAARQRYFAALASELEQRRQEQLLAARRSGFIRSQQARARLVAAERQHALGPFLKQFRVKGARPVCRVCGILVICVVLIYSSQITRQPHVVKRSPLVDTLKQRLATESDPEVTDLIRSILPSLEPRPVQSEKPKDSDEDAARFIGSLLSSVFPGLEFRTQPPPTPRTEQDQPSVSGKGKGKARAMHFEEPQEPAPTSEHVDEAFADILRRVMEISKGTPTRSPDEAGPSGSPRSSPHAAHPTVTEREQTQIDRAIALSSIEHVQNTLTKVQTDFVLPTELDHYAASGDDRDEIGSISSVSSSDLTKLIPYTSANKPVYKYENELSGLLEGLDKIDSRGDAEVREKRKEVVKAVEKALEGVEQVVEEAVGKRLSFISTTTPATEEPVRGFDVDEDTIEEVAPAQEPVKIPVVVDEETISEPATPDQVEVTDITPAEVSSGVNQALPQYDTPVAPEATAELPSEPTSTQSDIEPSMTTITPASVEPTPVTEPESTQSQVQDEAPEVTDTLLLLERVSPPSPVRESLEIDIETDDEVLVFDSDAEKSDWSELEGY